nr:hypothetical protein [uncultured Campylobacter sp.]
MRTLFTNSCLDSPACSGETSTAVSCANRRFVLVTWAACLKFYRRISPATTVDTAPRLVLRKNS